MRDALIRTSQYLKHNQHIESHMTALLTLASTALSFIGDIVSADLRWVACTMGIGLLVARSNPSHEAATHPPAKKTPVDVPIRYVLAAISHRGEDIIVELRPRRTRSGRWA